MSTIIYALDGSGTAIQLDSSLVETLSFDNEVTEHPVEVGANVTDNVRVKLDHLKVQGVLSDWPLDSVAATEFTVPAAPGAKGRAAGLLKSIEGWRNNAVVLGIETPLRTFDSMVIEGIDVPHDAKSGDSIQLTLTLKEIRYATSQTVAVQVTKSPRAKVDKGTVSGQSAGNPPDVSTLKVLWTAHAQPGQGKAAAGAMAAFTLNPSLSNLEAVERTTDYVPPGGAVSE